MNAISKRIFREAAIDRLSSPDQLDQLVSVTRPIDGFAAGAMGLGLVVLLAWATWGRIPTRVAGDGILVGNGGQVAEAVAGAGGRLSLVEVEVGDRVAKGQQIARLAQADIEALQRAAAAAANERNREYAELTATAVRETRAEDASDAAREAGFAQAAAAADERGAVLARNIKTTETLVNQGLATQPDLEQMREDLSAARQRAIDARNAELSLGAERLARQSRRARDLLAAQYRANEAHRDATRLAETLARESTVIAPIAGRVTEVKVSPGAFLAAGAPVAAVESDQNRLQAVVYLSPADGKAARPGMRVRIEPATVRRDEYGAMIGRIVSLSAYPATPEGMAATLHNSELVVRFSHGGSPYAAVVQLETDPVAPSGYRWSSGRGPALRVTSGTLVHAEVVTRERRPLDLLLPLIRRVSGGDR